MKYFNGFSLQNEEHFFSKYIVESNHCVVGFSYGAQKAFEEVYSSKERVDRLILLSPAFFQNKKASFLRTQLRYFDLGQEAYVKNFLENVSYPSTIDLNKYLDIGTKKELEELLVYEWDRVKLEELLKRGVNIEVFLGSSDKIIDSKVAKEFFSSICTTYFVKNVGHLLG